MPSTNPSNRIEANESIENGRGGSVEWPRNVRLHGGTRATSSKPAFECRLGPVCARHSRVRSLGVQLQKLLRHPIAAISAAVMVLATPALLFAHARLVRSSPAANAVLDSAPTTLGLWFSERPEPRF